MKVLNLFKSILSWRQADKKLIAAYSLGVAVILFAFFFLLTTAVIGLGVNNWCESASRIYSGDCVVAVIQFVEDESNDPQDRSGAVWALGQLGDERALPILHKLYDKSKCEYGMKPCRYELRKAINLIDGGTNITAPFWRWTILK